MGKSNSIAEQEKSNKAFTEYINLMNQDMEKHLSQTVTALDSLISKHYEPFKDKAILMEGQYSHLTTLSEWSLDSVNKIIDSCRNALFGSPVPAGSSKQECKEEVGAAITAMKSRELYIANSAFGIIQGLLGSFNNTTTTSVETKIDVKPLSPGLTLFIGVMNNSYSRQDFFKNEKIMQNMFVFKVYYSIEEGKMQSKLNDLEAYENQKVAFRSNLKKLDEKVKKLDIFSDGYLNELKTCAVIAEAINDRLEALDKKIKALTVNKIDGSNVLEIDVAEDHCKYIANSLQNRWEAAYSMWKNER